MLTIQRPQAKPSFFYGSIVSYQFRGDVSKDKGTYRIRFSLTFSSGKCIPTQKSGFLTKAEAVKAKEVMIAQLVNGSYILSKSFVITGCIIIRLMKKRSDIIHLHHTEMYFIST